MEHALNLRTLATADQHDIDELRRRIDAYRTGREDEERFKHYRLTRGVYGQRQSGVQMFRTKIPYGRLTPRQLTVLGDISERYTNGRLHLTTRQNIQFHYVKLQDSPAIWEDLAADGLTAREACGNTVRNVTASPFAGIDPAEPFDVTPYAQATFEYFLRNPICQEMGRKIKIAFSSSELDSAFTYFHDFGFIPRLREVDGRTERGFKVLLAGGLGAQSIVAHTVTEFMPEDEIIPFMEASLRVFDRFGEREKRMKARMKFLVQKIGAEEFLRLVEEERPALKNQQVAILWSLTETIPEPAEFPAAEVVDPKLYEQWLATNVLPQKQAGFYAVQVRVPLGNLNAAQARLLADLTENYTHDDLRLTLNQGVLLRFVPPTALPHLFNGLYAIDLALPGFDTTADVTACPGTDTCALGVTNSTGMAVELERLVRDEYPHLVNDRNILIKISGCMNSCGQHMAANIGLHGSSIRQGARIVPAMQVVLGGGITPDGRGFIAEKVVKLPTKRIPQATRLLFDDYAANAEEGEYYNDYVERVTKRYFYDLLKPLADPASLTEDDYFDWHQDHTYRQEIGVGECAGVALDVVGTIIADGRDKVESAAAALAEERFADAIYHAYSSFIVGAKALLLSRDIKCNTQVGILDDFQTHYIDSGDYALPVPFSEHVLRLRKEEPSSGFAAAYVADAQRFVRDVIRLREAQLQEVHGQDKLVIANYYKA